MPQETDPSQGLSIALVVSLLAHAALLSLPLAPISGKGLPFLPTRTQLAAHLISPALETAAVRNIPTEDARLIGSTPGASKDNPEITHVGPEGPIESSLSSPYLTSAEVDVRASPIDPPPLILPEFILRQHIKGSVELKVFISAGGEVDAIEVISSSHPGQLENEAVEVTMATRFSPAYKAGVAVKSVKRIEVIFDPDEPNAGPVQPASAGPVQAPAGRSLKPIPSATEKPRFPDSQGPAVPR
ncbi:MAG: hypothetical protein H6R10_90 [Rhodocyclaceae bacterium]|nr:hypothetical protein [Rhodocyclaceae bacterium]